MNIALNGTVIVIIVSVVEIYDRIAEIPSILCFNFMFSICLTVIKFCKFNTYSL